ncbi:Aste57867_21645 [Aphanomyces stellatus]|uniref:Aste57867_21645 protein n=1 Tax=Aphanomyces stellatus TaxID=120398 RepID=A0A485LIQ2_9STRA|nr:hypothetical protein As57867_021576 [Aphanomyces stellatus]VFT98314.1 Aste57867_21645 [Aphanomyces stellatus]
MDKSSPEYKEAVRDHAKTLGLDPDKDPQYLWIVEEALTAPLPSDWEQGETDDGTIYYFNVNTEESVWEHPMDKHYSELILKKKADDADAAAKKADDAKKAKTLNNAPKPVSRSSSAVQEFDVEDLDDQPARKPNNTKPANATTTKPMGFGKDAQSWLLDDEDDDFHAPIPAKASIVSAIKRVDDPKPVAPTPMTTKAAVVATPSMFKPQPTPVSSMTASVPPATPITPVPSSFASMSSGYNPQPTTASTSSAASTAHVKALEAQIETLKSEVAQLKREREASEKNERQSKVVLQREIESLQREKEAADVEAKESNYLRMKVNEMKAKIAALEAKKEEGTESSSSNAKVIADLETKLRTTSNALDDKADEVAKLTAQVAQVQAEGDRMAKKKEDEMTMKAKEHSIEVEDLREQLLMRQATNITLQHSTGDLERLKKKAAEQEDDLRRLQTQLTDQTATIAELRATVDEKDKKGAAELEAERKRRVGVEKDVEAARDRLQDIERERDEFERSTKQLAKTTEDVERKWEQARDEYQTAKVQLAEMSAKVRAMEDNERTRAGALADEKRTAERELQALYAPFSLSWDVTQGVVCSQERVQRAAAERDEAEKRTKLQKEEHVHAQSKWQLEMEELRREKERGSVQTVEVHALKKELESLNIDLARMRDVKSTADFELRNMKQTMSLEASQLLQCKAQLEEYTRKDFLEKQRLELVHNEKSAVEKKVLTLEAQLQTLRSEARTETDKYLFRLRELESLNARYEYDLSRADEKFATAEKWRLKEAGRVEQRDADILDLKEEVGRLKARNIEGENHHVINELRTATKVLEAQVKELKSQLQDEASSKAQLERQWAQDTEHAKKQVAAQIPQLAAAATQRACDEWKRRCDDVVAHCKSEFEESWLREKQQTSQREAAWYDERREMERQIKTCHSERDFLNKEISRLEDNNKHLMEQLHTIRVYLTQRPMHSTVPHGGVAHAPPPPPPPSQYPPSVADALGSQHLQNQLSILHAQFQQLFEHTATTPPLKQRHEPETTKPPSSASSSSVVYSPNNAHVLHEKHQLIRSMEELGPRPNDWVPVVESVPEGDGSSWYRKGYWRSKYS